MKNFFRNSKVIYNTLKYNYLLRQKSVAKPSDPSLLLDILDKYKKNDTVFVHIGLGQIKSAFNTNPYNFTLEALTKRFNNIIVPGFTPSFKKSRLFHKKYSIPEYGTFSGLFINDASYRTDDPIYSLLVYGDYCFDNLFTSETFGKGSCYEQLEKDNILCINIGTKWTVSSQIHYLEYKHMVPYIEPFVYNGVIYHDENNHKKITVTNYINKHWFNKYVTILWNRHKITKHLIKEGVLHYYNINGLKVFAFKLGDLGKFLGKRIDKQPYYLLT